MKNYRPACLAEGLRAQAPRRWSVPANFVPVAPRRTVGSGPRAAAVAVVVGRS